LFLITLYYTLVRETATSFNAAAISVKKAVQCDYVEVIILACMKLPKLENNEKCVGLYVFDFGDEAVPAVCRF
jgi:hypothetical protein